MGTCKCVHAYAFHHQFGLHGVIHSILFLISLTIFLVCLACLTNHRLRVFFFRGCGGCSVEQRQQSRRERNQKLQHSTP